MRSLKRKVKLVYLRTKKEVLLMGKKTLGAIILSGIVLVGAPFTVIAEDTRSSLETQVQIEQQPDLLDKASTALKGTGAQIKELWDNSFGTDPRLARKDAKINEMQKLIIELESKLLEKEVGDAVRHSQAVTCATNILEYLEGDTK